MTNLSHLNNTINISPYLKTPLNYTISTAATLNIVSKQVNLVPQYFFFILPCYATILPPDANINTINPKTIKYTQHTRPQSSTSFYCLHLILHYISDLHFILQDPILYISSRLRLPCGKLMFQ